MSLVSWGEQKKKKKNIFEHNSDTSSPLSWYKPIQLANGTLKDKFSQKLHHYLLTLMQMESLVTHKMFLELYSKTELQYSSKQLKQMGKPKNVSQNWIDIEKMLFIPVLKAKSLP